MSRLHASQVAARIRSSYAGLLNEKADLPDDMFLSRALAAHAIQAATDCTLEDAAKSVWDGQDDNGIDAAYYDADETRVVLVQAKWIHSGVGEPSAKDIGAFVKGAYDLIDVNAALFGERLSGRFADITRRLQEPGTVVQLIVVSTGSSSLSAPSTSHLDRFLADMNGGGLVPIASSVVLGLKEVYTTIASTGARGDVALTCQIFHWHFLREPYPAYFGLVDGITIKEWWQSYGKRLLSANIRHGLGPTEVNTQIRQTADEAPDRFWYFNNGITVIAEDTVQAPASGSTRDAGLLSLKGASIVNGAQTVSTLGAIEDEEDLGRIRVSIRVILLNHAPANFGEEVARANNLQNRIEARDFVAQDPQQHRIREEMAMEHVDYQYLRSDEFSPSANSCDVLEVTSALACATGKPTMAVQVKTGLGRFFNDLTKPPYTSVFNAGTSGARAFNAAICLRAIDEWIEQAKQKLPKKSGPRHGVLVHGNRMLASLAFAMRLSDYVDKSIVEFREIEPHSGDAFDELMEAIVAAAQHVLSLNYEGRHLAILFKNPSETSNVFAASMEDLGRATFKFDFGRKQSSQPTVAAASKKARPRARARNGVKLPKTPAPLI
ncbi:AIPR family protein [Stenotrophomonas rhizophila]|uniref:AIPR family protein n=1 Tax=Stenotrophomonas rhizophila TaxID=216778 RepID=UPI000B8633C6|nr:AIPR family protein [Stenotrophomonas rhizophila]